MRRAAQEQVAQARQDTERDQAGLRAGLEAQIAAAEQARAGLQARAEQAETREAEAREAKAAAEQARAAQARASRPARPGRLMRGWLRRERLESRQFRGHFHYAAFGVQLSNWRS